MCLYIWRHTIHGCNVLVDCWRSVLWKTLMTHIWQELVAKRDIGHIRCRRSNGAYNIVFSVNIILKLLWTGMLDQRGMWIGSSAVWRKYGIWEGMSIITYGFHIVMLGVWSWRGAGAKGNICWAGWKKQLLSEREEEWRLGLVVQNLIVVGGIYVVPKCSQADLMLHVSWLENFKLKFEIKNSGI